MKFLLAAVNAKYIHSNPAVYSLRAYAKGQLPELPIEIGEYTINHQTEWILQDIFRRKPDFIGFSCYIWNISYVLELVRDIKKVLPHTEIWLGGPEVSYHAAELLSQEPAVRGIMRGEGELTFSLTAEAYCTGGRADGSVWTDEVEQAICGILGISFRTSSGAIRENGPQRLLTLDEIPFYYDETADFGNRIIYYESSRGCPFSCSYCLSSIDRTVRFRSLGLVIQELSVFLSRRTPQVKFVDRTFNCNREHALAIWRYIAEHDNGVTNFHFEAAADLFDEEELSLIARIRPGLIQLEIGVQSTNRDTLAAIRRITDPGRIGNVAARIQSIRNVHLHLDLIAGLPCEDMTSFLHSFDDVYRMQPDALQLGFLKVLKGSHMEMLAESCELTYRSAPPYEVLSTKWLSYADLIRLKQMEEVLEVYYNSGQFKASMKLLAEEYDTPSALYLALAEAYDANGLFGKNHSRLSRYEILYAFFCALPKIPEERRSAFRDALIFDLYRRENAKSRPHFASDQMSYKRQIRSFFEAEEREPRWLLGYEGFDSRQMSKMAHLERMEDGSFILFDYKERSAIDYNVRTVRFVCEEENGRDRFLCCDRP